MGNSAQLLHVLKYDPLWANTKVAWVSCCDEPIWAEECLAKFKTSPPTASSEPGVPIGQVAHSSQIFKSSKQVHFQRLKKLYPEISFDEMLFFDNERGNISTVSQLGVKCVYCPDGMSEDVWQQGLRLFSNSARASF